MGRDAQPADRPARTVALELRGADGPKSQGAAAAQSRRPQGRRGGGTSPPRCGVSTVVAGGARSAGETGAAGTAPRLPSRGRALCMSLPQTWRNTAASVALLSVVALLTPCVSHRPHTHARRFTRRLPGRAGLSLGRTSTSVAAEFLEALRPFVAASCTGGKGRERRGHSQRGGGRHGNRVCFQRSSGSLAWWPPSAGHLPLTGG